MGDVFKAMNRARQERTDAEKAEKAAKAEQDDTASPSPAQAADEADGASTDDHAPALPLGDVHATPISEDPREVNAPRVRDTEADPSPVSTATTKSRATDSADVVPAAVRHHADSNLNGYSNEVVVHYDRGSVITEQYRAIRTQILARARNRRVQTHVVTSSAPEEGKSVTTINLGIAFTELKNKRTIIIEGDLRRPSFRRLFDRDASPGLIQYLRGEVENFEETIQPTVYDNLQFIPAGGRDFTSSTELLSSPRMVQLIDRLRDRYDHIFIDTPPVITVTDACILGAMCDETLLVVRLNKTATEAVDRAKRLLRASNCEVSGVILTHMQYHIPRYLYRYV